MNSDKFWDSIVYIYNKKNFVAGSAWIFTNSKTRDSENRQADDVIPE